MLDPLGRLTSNGRAFPTSDLEGVTQMAATQATRPVAARRISFIQGAVFVVSLLFVFWNVAGIIANSDFATGAHATSKVVLGVDFNGWHALSGFALFGPGLFFALRKQWAMLFAAAAAVALYATGIWAIFDKQPAGIFPFEHNNADAVLHIGGASVYAAAAAAQIFRDRRSFLPPGE
jgi:hypothetical protein